LDERNRNANVANESSTNGLFSKRHTPVALRHILPASSVTLSSSLSSSPTYHQSLSRTIRSSQSRCFASLSAAAARDVIKRDSNNDEETSSSKSNSTGAKKKKKKTIHKTTYRIRFRRRQDQVKRKKQDHVKVEASSENVALQARLKKLFDEIAPLVNIKKMENFLELLELEQKRKQVVKEAPTQDDGAARDPQNWMQMKILSFLDILPLHARPVQTMTSPIQANLKNIEEIARTFKLTRDRSVLSNDMTWSSTIPKDSPDHVDAATRFAYHERKTEKQNYREAKELVRLLGHRLPSQKFDSLVLIMKYYVQQDEKFEEKDDNEKESNTAEATKKKRKKNKDIKRLFNNINQRVGVNIHLVASDVAEFFYFDPPKDEAEAKVANTAEGNENNTLQGGAVQMKSNKKKIGGTLAFQEPIVRNASMEWGRFRNRFVEKMMILHNEIHAPQKTNKASSASSINKDDEDHLTSIAVATLERKDTLGTDESEIKINEASKLAKEKRQKRQVHVVFEAVSVDDHRGDKEYAMTSDRSVFIDNLPIDITEGELIELYSQCGPIESVDIFNVRPDLDPGPLNQSQFRKLAMQRRKQGRRPDSVSQQGGGWNRPRTPVYALLNFEEETVASTASQDALRIFGMIVRGHSVRSIRAKEITRLYIDNIPFTDGGNTRNVMDIEHSLSQLLNPDLFVSLDISSSSTPKSKKVAPTSCEIVFPSFEIAHEAFCILQEKLDLLKDGAVADDGEASTINWMKTPPDALQYWTRQLGGVM